MRMRASLAVIALAVLLQPLVSSAQVPAAQEGRERMRDRFNQSSLRDEEHFAANFEKLLRTAWQQHRELIK